MDYIRPIGPVERDIDPVYRVERTGDEPKEREQQGERKRQAPAETQTETQTPEDVGPVEGEDGHLHIDVRA